MKLVWNAEMTPTLEVWTLRVIADAFQDIYAHLGKKGIRLLHVFIKASITG